MKRRTFISTAGAAGLGFGGRLRVGQAESAASLLALLEDSSRERLTPQLVARIRTGLHPEALLAALSAAAARNVQPVPHVGFKYHSLMMLWAADGAAGHLSAKERWLPLLWAADYFKETQAEERATSHWQQRPRAPSAASAAEARRALISALDRWDREAADAAVVDCLHTSSAEQIFTLLFWYGARDLRDIGHKAISVANAHRLASGLDSSQLESVLRSTVAAIQNPDTEQDPATHDLEPDRAFRRSVPLLRRLSPAWKQGRDDSGARGEFRAALYRVPAEQAADVTVAMLRKGVAPESLWRVMFNTAAELILVQPNVITLHAQTTANALHYAYRVCTDEPTQQLMLLQCAAFISMFRAMTAVSDGECRLDALQPLPFSHGNDAAYGELASELTDADRLTATRKMLGYLQRRGDPEALTAWVRKTTAYFADDPHDYKYPEAVFENYTTVTDFDWRCRCLSAGFGLYRMPGRQPNAVTTQALELMRA